MTTQTLLIGISGVSSSGKTTLSRLLRDIFPNTFVLHEDDYYWSDNQIPFKNGVQDWDCIESIDVVGLQKSLAYIKQHGSTPTDLVSKEDQNSVGETKVDEQVVRRWKERMQKRMQKENMDDLKIAIVDGFLLFSQNMEEVWKQMDVRLFLRTNYATAKRRREARSGYVTLEGFWEDPPGYVDDIVWPNYVKEHAFLFKDGDVDGEIAHEACKALALDVMPRECEEDITACLEWACEIVRRAVEDAVNHGNA